MWPQTDFVFLPFRLNFCSGFSEEGSVSMHIYLLQDSAGTACFPAPLLPSFPEQAQTDSGVKSGTRERN